MAGCFKGIVGLVQLASQNLDECMALVKTLNLQPQSPKEKEGYKKGIQERLTGRTRVAPYAYAMLRIRYATLPYVRCPALMLRLLETIVLIEYSIGKHSMDKATDSNP